jgi:hypothetical protein
MLGTGLASNEDIDELEGNEETGEKPDQSTMLRIR